jgi:uncharacterized protein
MQSGFEWDPAKAASNLAKHNIAFEDAATIFDDLNHFIIDVTKPEYGENRYRAIGRLHGGRLVAIVYTNREERRRIISARKARKNEQREYGIRKTST